MDWSAWRSFGPDFTPTGFVSVFRAFEAIARRDIEDWVGNEFAFEQSALANVVPDPSHYFSPDGRLQLDHLARQHYAAVVFWSRAQGGYRALGPPSLEEWTAAHKRYAFALEQSDEIFKRKALVCLHLHRTLEAGDLRAHARNEATGEMVELQPHHWNCDHVIALARFSRGRVNLLNLMGPVPEDHPARADYFARMTSWLFVRHARSEPDSHLDASILRSDEATVPHKPDADACQALADALDQAPISKRRLLAAHIADRWDEKHGPAPTVESIRPLMRGGKKGAPPKRAPKK